MSWTPEISADTIWAQRDDAGSIWDDGETFWDVADNVPQSYWDVVPLTDSWSKESGV